ncbi:type II secretion system protein N [Hydrogenophaga sp.]|uniref:type II secretion system protein N n=1 Tax=Hydrogenophaga sp. TaxID=1904254 RepID=UPI002FC5AC3C
MNKHPTFGHSGFPMESPAALQGASRRAPAWVAGLLWLAAGLSAGYWILLAAGRSPVTPLSVAASSINPVDTAAVARVLGALPEAAQLPGTPVATGTEYSLLGVVAANAPDGAALIAVNGQPARPYRVGASLEGGLVLQAVSRRGARLGASINGPVTVELTMPETNPDPS